MAKSPARRLNSLKPNLASPASKGSRTSASNSSSASAVDMMPAKKSCAAIRAAHADRIMRDVARHLREQRAERIVDHGLMKRGVAHARADAQHLTVGHDSIEACDLVDVDEVCRLGQSE